jgi:hypothetical protein
MEVWTVECPQCGKYEIDGASAGWNLNQLPPALRGALSCATRQSSEFGRIIRIDDRNLSLIPEGHNNTSVSGNIDKLLRLIAARSRPGTPVVFNSETDFTLIDCLSSAEFDQYIGWTQTAELIYWTPVSQAVSGAPPQSAGMAASLSVAGWNRAQPAPRPGGIPGRVFVAMWFDPSMNEAFELGIARAVADCGFPFPLRIDQKEHNNQITDEIMSAIRDAEFVIADFTQHRGGVYYEAGFARALGRPVIHTCRDTDIGSIHFDTKLISHVVWRDPTDLRDKLVRRIKATIIPKA